jgi:ribosomal-protein-alanine N-acetyltransferase
MSEPGPAPVLDTPRLRLRPLRQSDAEVAHTMFGDPETMRFWDSMPARDLADTTARIRQSLDSAPQWHAAFAVMLREIDQVVGIVNYHARVAWHRRLAVGWIIATPWRRQGIMREAVTALLDHCFGTLETHRIEARIEPGNVASERLAERLGFRVEGLMRDWMRVGGEPRSAHLYALLRPDWMPQRHDAPSRHPPSCDPPSFDQSA